MSVAHEASGATEAVVVVVVVVVVVIAGHVTTMWVWVRVRVRVRVRVQVEEGVQLHGALGPWCSIQTASRTGSLRVTGAI